MEGGVVTLGERNFTEGVKASILKVKDNSSILQASKKNIPAEVDIRSAVVATSCLSLSIGHFLNYCNKIFAKLT